MKKLKGANETGTHYNKIHLTLSVANPFAPSTRRRRRQSNSRVSDTGKLLWSMSESDRSVTRPARDVFVWRGHYDLWQRGKEVRYFSGFLKWIRLGLSWQELVSVAVDTAWPYIPYILTHWRLGFQSTGNATSCNGELLQTALSYNVYMKEILFSLFW